MDIQQIHKFYQTLHGDRLSFIYQGDFSDRITEKITGLSEISLEHNEEMAKLKSKISFLIVECFQNIVRHGNNVADEGKNISELAGLFSTRNMDNKVFITSANRINNNDVPSLKEKLNKINGLDKDQLKALYMDILSNEELSAKGGAGLGLVEMARKSGNPLDYYIDDENQHDPIFYLMLKMQGKGNEVAVNKENISLENSRQMHSIMRRENILMIYKGDFAQDTILHVLKMIEENLGTHPEEQLTKKKVYFVLVEVLQNIMKHGKSLNGRKEGIFMIGKEKQKYIISTGNVIDNFLAAGLRNNIERINKLTKEELAAH